MADSEQHQESMGTNRNGAKGRGAIALTRGVDQLKYRNQGWRSKAKKREKKKYDTDRALSTDLRVPPGYELKWGGSKTAVSVTLRWVFLSARPVATGME